MIGKDSILMGDTDTLDIEFFDDLDEVSQGEGDINGNPIPYDPDMYDDIDNLSDFNEADYTDEKTSIKACIKNKHNIKLIDLSLKRIAQGLYRVEISWPFELYVYFEYSSFYKGKFKLFRWKIPLNYSLE